MTPGYHFAGLAHGREILSGIHTASEGSGRPITPAGCFSHMDSSLRGKKEGVYYLASIDSIIILFVCAVLTKHHTCARRTEPA
jgi:hypothetical protein